MFSVFKLILKLSGSVFPYTNFSHFLLTFFKVNSINFKEFLYFYNIATAGFEHVVCISFSYDSSKTKMNKKYICHPKSKKQRQSERFYFIYTYNYNIL